MPSPQTRWRVALPLPLPQLFDYLPCGDLPCDHADAGSALLVGRRARVPFGTQLRVGVIAEVVPPGSNGDNDVPATLRAAEAVLDDAPLLDGELLASLHWLSQYTHAPLGEVLATALPSALRRGDPLPDTHDWAWVRTGLAAATKLRGRPQRLFELIGDGACPEAALDDQLDDWRSAARALRKRGLIERVAVPASQLAATATRSAPELNEAQHDALVALRSMSGFAPVLLEGVTGSGKTEIYLHAIADCLARGQQALVLVPEIGLTPQTLARFRARLGVPVHALHSGLNDQERARVWAAAWRGEARVIVGTRSAVFTPLPDAGLIVIDEEHDGSYKQQDGIRYHARDFALVRGKALQVPVLLGSATPSLETMHNARNGRYAHLRLPARAGSALPPTVRVLDVRKRPLQAGLSPEALQAIRATLQSGGQVLVFKNRRGYAPVLLCHDCGWSAHCKRCSTLEHGSSMTVHAGGRRLQCHHCGARQSPPLACPDCASLALQAQGVGTERLEQTLAELFGEYPVLRIDRGSTQRKHALERHLASFGDAPGILIGTQMLAKGHDLPNLVLVVVVGIDEGLFSADFRAREKLAQLLIQVAGRAGRADKRGDVLLQTHHPEHPLLQTLLRGGYPAFAEQELAERQSAEFPPFAYLALLRAEAQLADLPMQFLHATKAQMETIITGSAAQHLSVVNIHGPTIAPMPKRAGWHRAQLLLAAPQRRALHAMLDGALPAVYALPEARKVRWSLDVDPIDLY